jgi:tRNA U34 2-thiouridine synthase MnmA/TrmU
MGDKVKAIGLFSGGLDSAIAARLMMDQHIEVIAVTFKTPFTGAEWALKMGNALGLDVRVIECCDDYMEIVKHPCFGYGKNMNPCIDCKIFMLRKARELMEQERACFVFTGEVLGQRPMSQQREQLRLIEKESGLEGCLLRPLSAKFLEPTIPEAKGIVDREKLLGIRGRGRREQIALAKSFGFEEFATPAGGCLLTDPCFSARLKEALDHGERDIELLKLGRHFRTESGAKIVVGRNEEENERINEVAGKKDMLIEILDFPGPTTLLRNGTERDLDVAASLALAYSDCKESKARAIVRGGGREGIIEAIRGLEARMI